MRHWQRGLSYREQEAKGERLMAAWEMLRAAGEDGVRALLDEAAKVDAAKERDDRFKLGAGAVLWQIGRFERVPDIVRLWSAVDLSEHYQYPFYCTFEAACEGDERALPLLRVLLRDQTGELFVTAHVMNLRSPMTHLFLWGPMGRKAVPALEQVLDTEQDPTALRSATVLLGLYMDAGALERLRRMALDAKHPARLEAIEALGRLGHPQDFELLCLGLAGKEPEPARRALRALCLYGDLRAVAKILPLTRAEDRELRIAALGSLGVLTTVEGLEALAAALHSEDEATQRMFAAGPRLLQASQVSWEEFCELPRERRSGLLAAALGKAEQEYQLRADDRPLSHETMMAACRSWIDAGGITGGEYEWVESRHLLAAATAADLPVLLDVRGVLFRRLSDECLDEVKLLDQIILRLVRRQYRFEPGLCDQVRPGRKGAPSEGQGKR